MRRSNYLSLAGTLSTSSPFSSYSQSLYFFAPTARSKPIVTASIDRCRLARSRMWLWATSQRVIILKVVVKPLKYRPHKSHLNLNKRSGKVVKAVVTMLMVRDVTQSCL